MRGVGIGQCIELIVPPQVSAIAAGSLEAAPEPLGRVHYVLWLVLNGVIAEHKMWQMLQRQSLCMVWRRRAIDCICRMHHSVDDESFGALRLLRDGVNFAVPNTLPHTRSVTVTDALRQLVADLRKHISDAEAANASKVIEDSKPKPIQWPVDALQRYPDDRHFLPLSQFTNYYRKTWLSGHRRLRNVIAGEGQ
eukprot:gene25294-15470_t